MNRSLVILATSLIFALACAPPFDMGLRPSRAAVLENQMMQADREFATATHARGIDGWMSFFAPDALRIVYGGGMVKGLERIRALDAPYVQDPATILNWEPLEAHVYSDGNTGVTIGKYSVVSRKAGDAGKELARGRYVTTWRRDNRKWLVIMDTGYPDPGSSR